jgi:hypothetical protein
LYQYKFLYKYISFFDLGLAHSIFLKLLIYIANKPTF